jgi:hypothetical protein
MKYLEFYKLRLAESFDPKYVLLFFKVIVHVTHIEPKLSLMASF